MAHRPSSAPASPEAAAVLPWNWGFELARDWLRPQPDPFALFALQMRLVRFHYERSLRFWMDLAAAAAEMQSELAACGTHLVSTEEALAGARLLRA
jgi:hypothetical protein